MVAAGELLEWARVLGRHCYGTPRAPVEQALRDGTRRGVRHRLAGPSAVARGAARRCGRRVHPAADAGGAGAVGCAAGPATMRRRSRGACALAHDEISHWPEFDHVVVNDDLDRGCRGGARRAACRTRRRRGRLTGLRRVRRSPVAQQPCQPVEFRHRQASPPAAPARCRQRAAAPRRRAPSARRAASCAAGRMRPRSDAPSRRTAPARAAPACGIKPDDCRKDLRRRHEGRRRNAQQQLACRQIHCASTDSRPYAGVPGSAQIRSATSCWNISVSRSNARPDAASRSAAASRCCRAGWRRPAAAPAPATARSSASASPATTRRRRFTLAASSCIAATARRSISTTVTLAASDASSARVRPPGPGPTSTTCRPVSGPAARTMRCVRLASSRKCCPSDRRAASPCRAMTSRSGGRAITRRRRAGRSWRGGAGWRATAATAARRVR